MDGWMDGWVDGWIVLTRLSGLRSTPTTSKKIW
jgi:hypothetical protein